MLKWLKVKDNRLSLYKKVRRRWRQETTTGLPGKDPFWYNHFKGAQGDWNYRLICDIVVLKSALVEAAEIPLEHQPIDNVVLLKIYEKYWDRIEEYAYKKGTPPLQTWTQVMKELLWRGWVFQGDIKLKGKWGIKGLGGIGLVWPKAYSDKEDAITANKRLGLRDQTSIFKLNV